jgi:hypothetical protein
MSSPKTRPKQYRTVSDTAVRAFTVLAVVAVVVAGASSWFAVRAVRGEVTSRASVVQLCQSGNDFRGQQVQLWTHIIEISAPPPAETPAQQRQRAALIASFRKYVQQVFAARDCGQLPAG